MCIADADQWPYNGHISFPFLKNFLMTCKSTSLMQSQTWTWVNVCFHKRTCEALTKTYLFPDKWATWTFSWFRSSGFDLGWKNDFERWKHNSLRSHQPRPLRQRSYQQSLNDCRFIHNVIYYFSFHLVFVPLASFKINFPHFCVAC